MPIPNVPLNMDQFGFAGRMTPSLGGPMSGFGRGFGAGPSGLMELLRKQQAMKDAIAKAQLDAMRAETNQYRKGSSLENAMREAELKRMNYPMQAPGPDLRREYLGEQMRKGGFSPLGFGGYSMQNAMKQMALAGEGGGQARFDNDSNALGGGAPPNFARQLQVDRLADQHARSLMKPDSAVGTPRGSLPPPPQTLMNAYNQYGRPAGGRGGLSVIGSREKGTLPGTVPKTGPYKLHKGEIVVSEPQADEPLLSFLVEDKLRKGITSGTPKGSKSYQAGSIPPDSSPEFWREEMARRRAYPWRPELPVPVDPETGWVQQTWRGRPLNDPRLRIDHPDPKYRVTRETPPLRLGSGRVTPALTPGRTQALLGTGEGGMTVTGPGVRQGGGTIGPSPKVRTAGPLSPARQLGSPQKLLTAGSPVGEIIEVVAKETGQEAKALKKLPKGVLLGMAAGLGLIYVGSKLLGGDASADVIPGAPPSEPFMGPPEPPASPASFQGAFFGTPVQPPDSPLFPSFASGYEAPFELDPVTGKTVPSKPMASDAAPQMQAEPLPMDRPTLPIQAGLAPEDQYSRDLEVALSRVGAGDLGTRESPLTVRGEGRAPMAPRGDEHLLPQDQYFAPENPEWRAAQDQKMGAIRAREKAEKLRSFLMDPNQQIDPDTRKELFAEAKWHDQIADTVEERFEIRKEKTLDRLSSMQEKLIDLEKEEVKARAKGEEMLTGDHQKRLGEIRKDYDEARKMYLDPKNSDAKEDILRAMVGSYVAQAKAEDQPATPEEAEIAVLFDLGQFDEVRARLEDAGASEEEIARFFAAAGGA